MAARGDGGSLTQSRFRLVIDFKGTWNFLRKIAIGYYSLPADLLGQG